jgi:hypothetical protein
MQDNSSKKNGAANEIDQRADEEINQRLTEHLTANAIRANGPVAANDSAPRRGFFAEAYAILGLIGLMIVAYLYTKLVGKEA